MPYCIHCGVQISDDAIFCGACGKTQQDNEDVTDAVKEDSITAGAPVPVEPTSEDAPPDHPDEQSEPTSGRIFGLVLLVVILLVAICAVIYYLQTDSNKDNGAGTGPGASISAMTLEEAQNSGTTYFIKRDDEYYPLPGAYGSGGIYSHDTGLEDDIVVPELNVETDQLVSMEQYGCWAPVIRECYSVPMLIQPATFNYQYIPHMLPLPYGPGAAREDFKYSEIDYVPLDDALAGTPEAIVLQVSENVAREYLLTGAQKGNSYTFGWFDGAVYKEDEYACNTQNFLLAYTPDDNGDYIVTLNSYINYENLDISLTREGYAVVDVSYLSGICALSAEYFDYRSQAYFVNITGGGAGGDDGYGDYTVDAEAPIQWMDSGFEALIREYLESPDADIYLDDLWVVDEIRINGNLIQHKDEDRMDFIDRSLSDDRMDGTIVTLEDLVHFPNLQKIHIVNNSIENTSALDAISTLNDIYLSDVPPDTVETVSRMPQLVRLGLMYSGIEDISVLSNLENLRYLRLCNNNIEDITSLSHMEYLEFLDLDENKINSIDEMPNLGYLEDLFLRDNNISNISSLSGLKSDCYLALEDNPIQDWSPVTHVEYVEGRD